MREDAVVAAMVEEVFTARFFVVRWNSEGLSANSAHREDGVFVFRAELVWDMIRDETVFDKMPARRAVWVCTDTENELCIFLKFPIIFTLL